MSQKVNGYLANDGNFFSSEAECQRHEHARAIEGLCESHEINSDNFFMLLREWHEHIQGYYHADAQCKQPEAIPTGQLRLELESIELSQADSDHADYRVRDKNVPGFLELTARGNK